MSNQNIEFITDSYNEAKSISHPNSNFDNTICNHPTFISNKSISLEDFNSILRDMRKELKNIKREISLLGRDVNIIKRSIDTNINKKSKARRLF